MPYGKAFSARNGLFGTVEECYVKLNGGAFGFAGTSDNMTYLMSVTSCQSY